MIPRAVNMHNTKGNIDAKLPLLVSLLPVLLQYQDINDIYRILLDAYTNHSHHLEAMPCCAKNDSRKTGYILYGTYSRKVMDLSIQGSGIDQKIVLEEKTLKIQRVCCEDCLQKGAYHTHALLFHLFIPYGHFSLRAVLYFLYLYFSASNGMSLENFCAEHNIPFKTFRMWIRWLKTEASCLEKIGILLGSEKKPNLKKFLENLFANFTEYYEKYIRLRQKVIFQNHASPANSVHLSGAILQTA